MKRSGFARKEYERKPLPPMRPIRQLGEVTEVFRPAPKQEYVRSKRLLEACRLIPCQWPGCGIQDGTVVAAHSNWPDLGGKSMAMKASDEYTASLCFHHHSELDQGHRLSGEEKRAGWLQAWKTTVAELQFLGEWPQEIPVPEFPA